MYEKKGLFFPLDDMRKKTQAKDTEENTPELDLLRQEQNRELYLALERLPADYRQTLYLLYFEDMNPDEAAFVMGKTKKKLEFSKLILFVFGLAEVGVVLFTCYMVHLTCDLTPLAYLIPSTAIVGATMVKNYYEKAKRENVIKLKKKYGVSLTQEDFIGEKY